MPRWLRCLVIVAISLGVVLRFTNVSHKAVGLDEGFSAFQLSGYGDRDAVEQLVTGKVIANRELQRFQFPNDDRGALDTVQHLALTAPESPPLYCLLLRGWVGLFGHTVTSLRLFSVAAGVLLIPAVYWLGQELFPDTWVGAVAMALVAQSPFHLLYAQEAMPYSLWTVLIVASSAALVRALRKRAVGACSSAWLLYSVILLLGLYCHLLHWLVVLSHVVFMTWREWGRWGQSLRRGAFRRYVIASILAGLLFAPWAIFALVNFDRLQVPDAMDVVTLSSFSLDLVKAWVRSWNLTLLDFNLDASGSRLGRMGLALLLGSNLVWMAVAIWQFATRAQTPAKPLLLSSVWVTALGLILTDVLVGGERSRASQYWLPAAVGIQLIMAFVLTGWLVRGPRRWGQVLLTGLLTMGLCSNSVMVMSWPWWSKSSANANLDLPALVREHGQRQDSVAESVIQPPLFVSDAFVVSAMAASHALPDEAEWLLVPAGEQPQVPNEYRNFYLYSPTPNLLEQMQQRYEVEPFNQSYWQVSRRS